mgnify:CR=1 FL=1|jgi:hypothetical protein
MRLAAADHFRLLLQMGMSFAELFQQTSECEQGLGVLLTLITAGQGTVSRNRPASASDPGEVRQSFSASELDESSREASFVTQATNES